MDIKDIMTEITEIMKTYDLDFNQALEIIKVKKNEKTYDQLSKNLNMIDDDIANLSKKLDKIISVISYSIK